MVTTKSYTFTNVTADHTIAASFARTTYEITLTMDNSLPSGASATMVTGGQTYTATPGSPVTVTVNSGDTVTFTATAPVGYAFLRWRGTQGAISTDNPYTVTVNSDRYTLMAAEFETSTHTITASAGTGGTITPSGEVSVGNGGSQTFTVTANSGYEIDEILVDGSPISLSE